MKYKRFSKKYVEYCPLQFLFLCKNSVLLFVSGSKGKKRKMWFTFNRNQKSWKVYSEILCAEKGFFSHSSVVAHKQTPTGPLQIFWCFGVFIYISFHLYHRHKTFFKKWQSFIMQLKAHYFSNHINVIFIVLRCYFNRTLVCNCNTGIIMVL